MPSTPAEASRCRVAPETAIHLVLRRFLQVEFQSVEMADDVEAVPWFVEREAEVPVVRDRAREVIDKKVRSEGMSHAASSRP